MHDLFAMTARPDLGRYLQSVMERDIDLLLMEEFHAEPAFVQMFCELVGLEGPCEFDGAWHSLSDAHGETDLLLRVKQGATRLGVLIENKVIAPAQPDQDGRYHLRAVSSQQSGHFDAYVTAICAPRCYLDGVPPDSQYQHLVSYEAIRDWFAVQPGRRAAWRATIMAEAIEQGRRGYSMIPHTGMTSFHRDFWEFLTRYYPQFQMPRPTPKGGGSTWIIFKGHSFPKCVRLNYKVYQGVMDLAFDKIGFEALEKAIPPDLPSDIIPVRTQKSSALRLPVPRCDFAKPVAEQTDLIREVLDVATRLLPHANIMTTR